MGPHDHCLPQRPVGTYCPRCGRRAVLALDNQAFCLTDGCPVIAWDPRKTAREIDAEPVCEIHLDDD